MTDQASRPSAPEREGAHRSRPAPPPGDPPAPRDERSACLTPAERCFVRALVDHMVPADALTPSGSALGIDRYIDRALASAWGQGARLYRQGPWPAGSASQGYQLPLTPAQLWRTGLAAVEAHCLQTHGCRFSELGHDARERVLLGLQSGELTLRDGPPARVFFALVRQCVLEGLFADPAHGGNRDGAGWALVGFPGARIGRAGDLDAPADPPAPEADPDRLADPR